MTRITRIFTGKKRNRKQRTEKKAKAFTGYYGDYGDEIHSNKVMKYIFNQTMAWMKAFRVKPRNRIIMAEPPRQ